MKCIEIRLAFEDYFAGLGYYSLPRAPLLHDSIPMSFVMSAGLVQIETSLSRLATRPGDEFTLVQECFRQFDVDKVATDYHHLSLFQMPGAFRFGRNAKSDLIRQMWQLATGVLKIDERRLWASYFAGDSVEGRALPPDIESCEAWHDLGLSPARVVGLGRPDNYWLQGNGIEGSHRTRRCGPNTELFYDRDAEFSCGMHCRPGCRCGRFIEFSNSLFIESQVDTFTGEWQPMAEPFSEIVIGTERVAMLVQQVPSVFDVDEIEPVVRAVRACESQPRVSGVWKQAGERLIADHLRALYLLCADGAPPPGKNGRARIVRRLIRAVAAHQVLLDIRSANFLDTIIEALDSTMTSHLSSEGARPDRMRAYFESEVARFTRTLERGMCQLERHLSENPSRTLQPSQVIALEKEWGLPNVLIAMTLKTRGLAFDRGEYAAAFQAWREKSGPSIGNGAGQKQLAV